MMTMEMVPNSWLISVSQKPSSAMVKKMAKFKTRASTSESAYSASRTGAKGTPSVSAAPPSTAAAAASRKPAAAALPPANWAKQFIGLTRYLFRPPSLMSRATSFSNPVATMREVTPASSVYRIICS